MTKITGKILLIRADASINIGTGHLMRCLALAQAWKDAGGEVAFITACRNEGLVERLWRKDLRFIYYLLHILTLPIGRLRKTFSPDIPMPGWCLMVIILMKFTRSE